MEELNEAELAERRGGFDRRAGYCGDHANCVYRIELMEKWRSEVSTNLTVWRNESNEKFNSLNRLLLVNLGGIIALLLSTTIGTIIWIAQH
jgi:hypothetical protein